MAGVVFAVVVIGGYGLLAVLMLRAGLGGPDRDRPRCTGGRRRLEGSSESAPSNTALRELGQWSRTA